MFIHAHNNTIKLSYRSSAIGNTVIVTCEKNL